MDLEAALTGTPYKSRLDVIKQHSEDVWKKGTFHHTYYTLHGMDHSRAVISILNKLVDGIDTDKHHLTNPEIFYLLASVYLHDVGMLIPRPDDVDRAKEISARKKRPYTKEDLIRDEHHLRSGKYVTEHAGDLNLDHVESECVKLICEGHRVVKLDTEEYNDRLVGNERIRVRLLTALLRFSDELDISYQRAPKKLMALLEEDMPDYSRLQWLKHYYTSGVGISVQQSNGMRKTIIEIQTQYPDRERGRKITEELIVKPIGKSRSSVNEILLEYGLNIKLNLPEIYFNENLDEIPERVYDKYLGQKLKVSMEIPRIKSFVGRNSELLALLSLLDKNIIIIEGIAGIGKTYVAARFADEIKDEYNVHWYGDLSEVSTLSSVMQKLAVFLKDNGRPRLLNSIENFGYDIDVLLTILKDELVTNRFAIFFDNYHKAEDELDILMKQLLCIESSKIILITREEPAFYNVVDERENRIAKIKIDPWGYEDTQDMFRLRGIRTADDITLREIHDRLHGHPQYLNLFCILAQKSKPETLLEKLPRAREDAYSYLEDEVYNSLEADEKLLLKIISVYRIPETIDAFYTAYEFTDIDEILKSLIHKFLVNEIGIDAYNVHEVICDYCDIKKKKTLRNYHKSAAEYYLSKDADPESLLEASYHYIEAGEHEKSAEIAINNAHEFINKGFWNKIEEPLNNAIKTLRKRRDDRNAIKGVGLAHLSMGTLYEERGDLDIALKHAQDSSKAFMRINKGDIFQLYTLFGSIYRKMGKIDESMEYFGKSLEFAEKNNDDYKKAVASANIGTVYSSERNETKALELYLDSLNFFEEHNYTKNIATSCANIASVYSDLNDHNKAYDFIKKAIRLYKETGATYHIADAYVTYAEIYLNDPANKGNLGLVLQCLSKSLETYEKIGHVRGEASIHSDLGSYYKMQKDYKSAIENYEKSISIYKILNEESKLGNVYSSVGFCYVKLKNYQNAKECFEESLESNPGIEAKLSLAEVYINLEEFGKAVDMSKSVLYENDTGYRLKCLAHIFMSISLFSLDKEADSYTNLKELIQYHSTNKSTSDELGWDFSDLTVAIENLDSSKCILIKDVISLIQNKTTYPAIRIDQVNIERVKAGKCAEVFHPLVGFKTITKNDDSLKKIMKDLSKGDTVINSDESMVMGIERDTALMTLGFLYKKGFIDFKETAPNILKIVLTDRGQKVPKFAK